MHFFAKCCQSWILDVPGAIPYGKRPNSFISSLALLALLTTNSRTVHIRGGSCTNCTNPNTAHFIVYLSTLTDLSTSDSAQCVIFLLQRQEMISPSLQMPQ